MLTNLLFPSSVLFARATHVKKLQRKLETQLTHKTILITGASYGIGEQLAYLLAWSKHRIETIYWLAWELENKWRVVR